MKKYFVKIADKNIEVKPVGAESLEMEVVEVVEVADEEKCEVISKWLKETQGYTITPEKILKCKVSTPSGKTLTALSLYGYAKDYFEENRG
ncbi:MULTISPECIES: hypothetical protein [Bacillus]|uniref:hypothetical protein n=1 Tax=Bacillus TaxID=1386 RepID=UPI003D64C2BB